MEEGFILWLIDIVAELCINAYYAISGQKENRDAVKSIINSSALNSIRDTMVSYFNKDINRLNDLIRAYQRKDTRLAASILMSSPVGSRITALQKQVADTARKIDATQHEIEAKSAKADEVAKAYEQASNFANTNPEVENLYDYYYAQELASGTPYATAQSHAMQRSMQYSEPAFDKPNGTFRPITEKEKKESEKHAEKIRKKFEKK